MTIFGRRSRSPAFVDHAPMHVFLVHFVEHDKVIACNAPDMSRAISFARTHTHVIEPHTQRIDRVMMYDDDRICVMMYGTDMQYTCNIMHAPVHDHASRVDITIR